jgi:hypothetical protein
VLVVGAANPLFWPVDRLVGPRLSRVYALDSNPDSLTRGAQRIHDYGVPNVSATWYPSRDPVAQRAAVAGAFDNGDIDVVVIGPSPRIETARTDPTAIEDDTEYLERALIDIVNLAGQCATSIAQQGHGVITLFTHTPRRVSSDLDHDYCAAMAALHLLAPSIAKVASANGGKTSVQQSTRPRSERYSGPRQTQRNDGPLEVASEHSGDRGAESAGPRRHRATRSLRHSTLRIGRR